MTDTDTPARPPAHGDADAGAGAPPNARVARIAALLAGRRPSLGAPPGPAGTPGPAKAVAPAGDPAAAPTGKRGRTTPAAPADGPAPTGKRGRAMPAATVAAKAAPVVVPPRSPAGSGKEQGPAVVTPRRPAPPAAAATTTTEAPVRGMDPRIRQRRIDVRRQEGRRRLRILVGCLAVAGAAVAAVGLGRSPLFDVDYVDVRGIEHTARADVLAAGQLAGHPALLDVDTRAVAGRVEALPWVLDARAHRRWPGTVRIEVTERRPLAVVPAGPGLWAVADRSGRVLAVSPDKPDGIPVIANLPVPGPPGTSLPAGAQPALRVVAALPEALYPRIADVAAADGGEVDLQLSAGGGWVRLGEPDDLAHKLDVLATLLARADLNRVEEIDIRVPAAPTLTRR